MTKSKTTSYTIDLIIVPKGLKKSERTMVFGQSFKDNASYKAVVSTDQFKKLWPKEECDFYKERI